MKCNECNSENLATTKFCTRCGQPLGGPAAGGGQVRKTVGMENLFEATPPPPPASPFGAPPPPFAGAAPVSPFGAQPAASPAAFQAPASAPSGQVRRTVLEEPTGGGGGGGFAMPAAPVPAAAMRPSAPVPAAGGGRRTVLDEGPLPGAAPGPGGAPGAPVAPSPGVARVVGWMVSFDRNPAGQDYQIRAGRNRIGRSRDCDISLFFEPKASDVHAAILWRNGNAAVIDENSTNGTLVNGDDIGIGKSRDLQSGDTLTIGGSTFVVFLIDPRQARTTWPGSAWAA